MGVALVVDDSKLDRLILAQILDLMGIEFDEAEDGSSALEKAFSTEKPYSLILLDHNMPRMKGMEVVARLRQDPRYATTTIIVVSARDPDWLKSTSRQVGASGWMAKPINPEAIQQMISQAIEGGH